MKSGNMIDDEWTDLPSLTSFIGEGGNFKCIGSVILESSHTWTHKHRHPSVVIQWNQVRWWLLPFHLFPPLLKYPFSPISSSFDAPALSSFIQSREFLSNQSPVSFNKHTNNDETSSQSLESMCWNDSQHTSQTRTHTEYTWLDSTHCISQEIHSLDARSWKNTKDWTCTTAPSSRPPSTHSTPPPSP